MSVMKEPMNANRSVSIPMDLTTVIVEVATDLIQMGTLAMVH